MSDQQVAEALPTQHKHKTWTSMSWAGFEPTMTAIGRLHTYVLDHTATGVGQLLNLSFSRACVWAGLGGYTALIDRNAVNYCRQPHCILHPDICLKCLMKGKKWGK